MATSIIIFGATGDLATKKIFPALTRHLEGDSSKNIRIIAIGRRPIAEAGLSSFLENKTFAEAFTYQEMDMTRLEDFQELSILLKNIESPGDNRLFYLAIPPTYYTTVLGHIADTCLVGSSEGWQRVVVEKPFGTSEETARELDVFSLSRFSEDQLYRVDHYLGKETIQNILAFRFSNRIFAPLWAKNHIDHVQITVAEEEGIKNRGAYYDATGAIRDCLQNHVLQLLALISLEIPASLSFNDVADKKYELLQSVVPEIDKIVLGQYEGYPEEANVNPESQTETYVMSAFQVKTERFEGVPFYVRTGKKLSKKVSEISIQFKKSNNGLFSHPLGEQTPNILTFRLQPDEGIALKFNIKTPRYPASIQPVQMEFCYGMSFKTEMPEAYELIFQDVLAGEHMHSLRSDSIEASWRIVDQILAAKDLLTVHQYAQGSWGPAAADDLLEAEGRRWLTQESEVCNGIIMNPL